MLDIPRWSVAQFGPLLAEKINSTHRFAVRLVVGLFPGREVYRKLQGQNYIPSPAILRIKGWSEQPLIQLQNWLSIQQHSLLSVSTHPEANHQLLSKKEEEERRVAQMGRPVLGEHVKLEVIIEESYEFKVRVVNISKYSNKFQVWDLSV